MRASTIQLAGLAIGCAGVIGLNAAARFHRTPAAPDQEVSKTVGVRNLAPGDTTGTVVDVMTRTGRATISARVTRPSLLERDTKNGLQVQVETCEGTGAHWTVTHGTHLCTGHPKTVLSERPLRAVSGTVISHLATTTPNALLIRERLPRTADNSFMAMSTTVVFTFTEAAS